MSRTMERRGQERRQWRFAMLVLVVGLMVVFGRTALLTRLFFAERAAADRAAVIDGSHGHDVIRHARKHLPQGKSRRLALVPLTVDDDGDDDGDDDCLCSADALPCPVDFGAMRRLLDFEHATFDDGKLSQTTSTQRSVHGARAPPVLRLGRS